LILRLLISHRKHGKVHIYRDGHPACCRHRPVREDSYEETYGYLDAVTCSVCLSLLPASNNIKLILNTWGALEKAPSRSMFAGPRDIQSNQRLVKKN
jgi:hypothetical protein